MRLTRTGILASSGGAAASLITANRIAEFALDEDTGRKLFNLIGGNTADNNLIFAPEKAWLGISNIVPNLYTVSECTLTQNYAANSDGLTQMLRIETLSGSIVNPGTGSFAGIRIQGYSFNAGQYTLTLFNVKSNTGSAQNMRMACVDGSNISGDLAVGTTIGTVSWTFTHPGGSQKIYVAINDSAGNPLDISIDKIKLEAGSSATAYVTPDFDMGFSFPGSMTTYDPSWVTGKGIAFANKEQWAYGIGKIPPTVTNISGYVIAKVSSSSTDQNLLFHTPFGQNGFELYGGEGGTTTSASTILPRIRYRNNLSEVKLTKVADGQYHCLAFTYDGTTLRYYIDGVEQSALVVSLTSVEIKTLAFNDGYYVRRGGVNEINHAILYSVGHSAAEVMQNYNALKTKMAAEKAITLAANTIAIAVEGDSITIDVNTYARKAIRNMVPLIAENFARVGATVSVLEARKATVKAWLNASTATTKILSVFIGANDLVSQSGATVLANLKAYCLDMKADVAGLLINVCSALPRDNSSQLSNRAVYNPLLVADTSFYDVLTPFHLNADMGNDADAIDTAKYPDGTHPSNAGHVYITPDWKTAIETLI